VEQRDATGGAVRVGIVWGGIGGAVGFVASLLGSLAGILVAGVVGVSCGRRAAEADAGRRTGALSGLLSGVVAAPVYVLGATAGAVVAAREIGSARLAAMLSEMLGTPFSSEEAWQLFLLSLILAAVFQVVVLVLASTATGAWVTRER
jgi:ABC-type dipeptide/oligopeptide/nickel transport system permease component